MYSISAVLLFFREILIKFYTPLNVLHMKMFECVARVSNLCKKNKNKIKIISSNKVVARKSHFPFIIVNCYKGHLIEGT